MQIVPVVLVLGAVSWVVCAVSVEGQAESHLLWRGRLGAAAERASSRVGALWVGIPAARRAFWSRGSRAARAAAVHASEVVHGILGAAAATRDGVKEDSAALSEQAQGAWLRLRPVVRPPAAAAVRTVEAGLQAATRGRTRRLVFRESLSMTGVGWASEDGFPLAEPADQGGYRVRGLLGLIVLIAVIGAVVAAGLIGFGWGLKHLIMRGRA